MGGDPIVPPSIGSPIIECCVLNVCSFDSVNNAQLLAWLHLVFLSVTQRYLHCTIVFLLECFVLGMSLDDCSTDGMCVRSLEALLVLFPLLDSGSADLALELFFGLFKEGQIVRISENDMETLLVKHPLNISILNHLATCFPVPVMKVIVGSYGTDDVRGFILHFPEFIHQGLFHAHPLHASLLVELGAEPMYRLIPPPGTNLSIPK
jgi:hypothetical protein